jgi:SAM-dependent methyltransferase
MGVHQHASLEALFACDRAVREIRPGLYSVLPESTPAAAYDRKAAVYEAIVGRPMYHRLVWGTALSRYAEFARAALSAAGSEPFADIGCGSLLFTSSMYSETLSATAILSDRSQVMLQRALKRLPRDSGLASGRLGALHADASALPLVSHAFSSILLLNLLHVPCDRAGIIAECGRLLIPGRGRLFVTCLVRSGRWSDAVLTFFHRVGEMGLAVTRDEACEMVTGSWGRLESVHVEGNMAFIVANALT